MNWILFHMFRFNMPPTPLRRLKPELFEESEEELDVYDSEDDNTDIDADTTPLLLN